MLPFKVNKYIPKDIKKYNVTDLINENLISNLYTIVEIGTPPQRVTSIITQDENTFLLSSEICKEKKLESVSDYSIVSKKGIDMKNLNINDNDLLTSTFNNYLNEKRNIGVLYQNISLYNTTFLSSQPIDRFNKNDKIDSKTQIKNITMVIKDYKEGEKLCGKVGIGSPHKLTGEEIKLRYIPSIINTLKKENIIDEYSFTFKFYYRDEGRFIIGAKPHEYEEQKNYYSEERYKTIKTQEPNNVDFPWSIRFNSIYFTNQKNETIYIQKQLKTYLSPNLGFIIGEETYKNQIIDNYFQPLIDKKICMLEKTQMTKFSKTNYLFGTNGIYEVIHCNSSITIFGRNFPKLYLENKEENLFFTLTFNDLFQEIEEKYIFLVIFPENSYHTIHSSWYLGIPFYKAHQLVFNYDSKTIGLYLSKDQMKVINENNNNNSNEMNEKEEGSKRNVVWIILEILFGLCLVVIAFFIGKKINEQRKKRANELDDDYDYYSNKKNIINDINEKDENPKIDKSNVEMASTFGI